MQYIQFFHDISRDDVAQFGGKNASIGEMVQNLSSHGIRIPDGFATTSDAYWRYLDVNGLREPIQKEVQTISANNLSSLRTAGQRIRDMIVNADMPDDVAEEIRQAYHQLSHMYDQDACDVAIRSSATAEDLPNASFAGQQDTFLHVSGEDDVIAYCKRSIASLFTDRAIVYRENNDFQHMSVALSVGVHKMVRSDKASSGVVFTLDTETGFKDVISITSSYGLGETIVKGEVNPDEFLVNQSKVQQGYAPIMQKRLGDKRKKMIYTGNAHAQESTEYVDVPRQEKHQFSLTDDEICELARYAATIEEYYSRVHDTWYPMDIEWAKDGIDGHIYIVQARPETVHSQEHTHVLREYELETSHEQQRVIVQGQRIGRGIASGKARSVVSIDDLDEFHEGDILVTQMTGPDWVPIMKKASAIITDLGGRTCHAAIVSRELGVPAVIGTNNATETIQSGDTVTLNCSHGSSTGYVYKGDVPYTVEEHALDNIPDIPCDIYINLADPNNAFNASFYPVDGIGLARLEFIIANIIQVHPRAAQNMDAIENDDVRKRIHEKARGYENPKDFFVDVLAQSIGHMAGAMYPRPVIVRLSDFKTHEYRELIAGEYFEPDDEPNPMLGFRGASRYTHEIYRDAFALECQALYKARYTMGFDNITPMIPFVRTIDEAQRVRDALAHHNIVDNERENMVLYMMVEVPSNTILLPHFADYFDGFSIGSNDLTQLVLGVDRDSQLVSHIFDERDPAVKHCMKHAIQQAQSLNAPIGICGQAPSDYPEIAQFLVDHGVDSMSLNLDSVMPLLKRWSNKHV